MMEYMKKKPDNGSTYVAIITYEVRVDKTDRGKTGYIDTKT